jgi:methylenetetrahydrofolate reductase (NADPH)
MKVTECIQNGIAPFYSFELLPPNKGSSIDLIYRIVDSLIPFQPSFITVTYHQPHIEYVETSAGVKKIHRSKRPGTVGICAAIKYKFGIETVPHMICGGFDKYETEDALIDLHYLGIQNVFVVRGDPAPGQKEFIPEKDGHVYAYQLVQQITNMNQGIYLEDLINQTETDFCVGVAGYPEKHFESPNLEFDIWNLKQKIKAGAEYVITQMFFEAQKYIDYVELLRKNNITIPVIPGIKPITSEKQLYSIPKNFYVEIPPALTRDLLNTKSQSEFIRKGIRHTIEMVEKLLDYGVPGIHFFTMSNTKPITEILKEVQVHL